jgi:hypothetical protein
MWGQYRRPRTKCDDEDDDAAVEESRFGGGTSDRIAGCESLRMKREAEGMVPRLDLRLSLYLLEHENYSRAETCTHFLAGTETEYIEECVYNVVPSDQLIRSQMSRLTIFTGSSIDIDCGK